MVMNVGAGSKPLGAWAAGPPDRVARNCATSGAGVAAGFEAGAAAGSVWAMDGAKERRERRAKRTRTGFFIHSSLRLTGPAGDRPPPKKRCAGTPGPSHRPRTRCFTASTVTVPPVGKLPQLYRSPSHVYTMRSPLYTSALFVYRPTSGLGSCTPRLYTFSVPVYTVQSIVYTTRRSLYTAQPGERRRAGRLYTMEGKLYTGLARPSRDAAV